jgi:16S rRNA (cytosine1402-N4)-methyltransferase
MVDEVLAALDLKVGGRYVDCTVGEGGHSLAILEAGSDIRVLGIDLDAEARQVAKRRLGGYGDGALVVGGNFADVGTIADENGFTAADGVLFDLGLSSLQIDTDKRGFSFRREARLDMRFDTGQTTTAHELVNEYPEDLLADVISRLGEEPGARRIARAVVRSRPIETTTGLANVIARAAGRAGRRRIHPATRTFQAIRMAVNSELENLQRGLGQAIQALGSAGRLVVISYHSLEDRLVKSTLRREASSCVCPPGTPVCVCGHSATVRLVHRKVIKPTDREVAENPRSRSARLRTAERI